MHKQVRCIRDDWQTMLGPIANIIPTPKKGETYIVIDESVCKCGCGAIGYELEEFPLKIAWRWRADWFSDVAENEVPELSGVSVEDLISVEVLETV